MHMLPAYYTTTNTRKRKQKKKTASAIKAEVDHQKWLKTNGYDSRSVAQPGSASALGAEGQRFESSHSDQLEGSIPVGVATKRKPNIYSGERRLLGIATMHKSNLVPVWGEDDAIDIARMRR
jgi:hypothetical protein